METKLFEHLLLDIRSNGAAHLAINRPERLNAFNGQTLRELEAAYRSFKHDSNVGVVVLTGVGERAFCAGGDVNWEAEGSLETGDAQTQMMLVYEAMRDSLKPTIARVNGYAIGGGHHLHYFCDLTIAADHAVFGQNGPRVGSPASGWVVTYLVSVLGAKRAREMWMLCRRYDAKQALEWGLVNAVVPLADLDAEVDRWCDDILSLSPSVIKMLKKSFDDAYEPLRASQDQHDYVAEVNPGFFTSGEQQEGAQAFLEKRVPDFSRFR